MNNSFYQIFLKLAFSSICILIRLQSQGQNTSQFVTLWDLSIVAVNLNVIPYPNTELAMGVTTAGTCTYSWEEVGGTGMTGSGTFSGSNFVLTGLPNNARIKLKIDTTNFRAITFYPEGTTGYLRGRLVEVQQWGLVHWSTMANAFRNCLNLQLTATDVPDLSQVTNMEFAFFNSYNFTGHPSMAMWNTSHVDRMRYTFEKARVFNQDIGGWDVSNVKEMDRMLWDANAFNQNLSAWDLSGLQNKVLLNMLDNTGMDCINYTNTLQGWANNMNTPNDVVLDARGLHFSDSIHRLFLINQKNWQIVDDGFINATWYQDADGDGYGNASMSQQLCSQPSGYVADNTDCNDMDFGIKPGVTDNTCDGIDNDCDNSVDEDAPVTRYYRDADGDGYGNASIFKDTCATPIGYVANSSDCNDQSAISNPGATEVCDGLDNDCDGMLDENMPTTLPSVTTIQPTCTNTGKGSITVINKGSTDQVSFDDGQSFQTSNTKGALLPGTYLVRMRSAAGCVSAARTVVLVSPSTTATINNLQAQYHRSDPPVSLSGTPILGTFKIDGTTAYSFIPSLLSPGNHTVSYHVTSGVCTASVFQTVLIIEVNTPWIAQCQFIETYHNVGNGLWMTSNGATISQQSRTQTNPQKWLIESVAGGYIRIKNNTGQYLKTGSGNAVTLGTYSSPTADWKANLNTLLISSSISPRTSLSKYLTVQTNNGYTIENGQLFSTPGVNQHFRFKTTACPTNLQTLEPRGIENTLTLYPNPNQGRFRMVWPDHTESTEHGKVEVYNSLGQKVYNAVVTGKFIEMQLKVSGGIYWVHWMYGKRRAVEKVVVNE